MAITKINTNVDPKYATERVNSCYKNHYAIHKDPYRAKLACDEDDAGGLSIDSLKKASASFKAMLADRANSGANEPQEELVDPSPVVIEDDAVLI